MSKGYTTASAVEAQLGRTLTPPQVQHLLDVVIPAAEEWVDETTGRAYGEGAVTAEHMLFGGPYSWLNLTPVQSIEAIRVWLWGQSVDNLAVLDPAYYSLIDPRNGLVLLPSWRNYEHIEVDYTPDPTIPPKVALATTILAGYYMRTVVHPETEWLTDYSSGQDVRLKFREMKIPASVNELLGSGGGNYVIA
jgi:hypothetical protein